MTKQQAIQLFEQKQVRTVWDDEQDKWYVAFPFWKQLEPEVSADCRCKSNIR